MYRRGLGASKDALPDELQAIWDAINRMRQEFLRSIMPEGYTWSEDGDGNIVIVEGDTVVSIGGGGGGVAGPAGPAGSSGPAGPIGPEGPTEFIKVAKWLVD